MSKLFISGGTVIDPETLSRFQADVLCEDGRIAAVQPAPSGAPKDARVIDASGCFVCPGFIDPHGHIDGCKYTGTLSLLQGITTTVGGNCGFSPLDIDAFLRSQTAFPIHQAEMIGLCALRDAAGATDLFAPAKRAQVHTMETLCERALQSGAVGVSLGPGYAPGTSLEEMEALCTMARRYGRPAAIDTRMFAMTDLNSLSEAIELAEVTGCRMIVSHFEYQYGVGVEYKALEMLELARARGVDMRLDSGMYKDWCSSIGSALFEPVTMRDNGIELRHLRVITGEHIGLVPDQALYEHLRAAHPCDAVVVNTGSEEAVYTIQRYPMTMVSTDTGSYAPGEGHPQIAGSFPRYLRKMVIERGELSWEQAIAHTTLLPAQTMGFGRKGRIRAGMDADLLVFDPETICDHADFPGLGRPDAAPEGIRFVIVSGEIAAENGRATGVIAGKTLNSFDFIHSSRRAMAGD